MSKLKDEVSKFEKELIKATYERCMFNATETAKVLGIGRATIHRKLAQYKIEKEVAIK